MSFESSRKSRRRYIENHKKLGLCIHCNKKAREGMFSCRKHGKWRGAIKPKWKYQGVK